MKEIIMYGCSFCSKVNKLKQTIRRHEKKCHYNPKNRKCNTCKHNKEMKEGYSECDIKDLDYYYDVSDGLKTCNSWELKLYTHDNK